MQFDQGSLSHRAYNTVREALTQGEFRPGERILLHELASRLGTSVTPAREACLRLVSERGLELKSGRFVSVPELTMARYLEIRTIRLTLECLAVEHAAKQATKTTLADLKEIQNHFATARRDNNFSAQSRLNRDFHLGAYRISGMPILVSHIESLWVAMGPILKLYHEEINIHASIPDHHEALIDALGTRDGKAARATLEKDILDGGAGILHYLKENEANKRIHPLTAAL